VGRGRHDPLVRCDVVDVVADLRVVPRNDLPEGIDRLAGHPQLQHKVFIVLEGKINPVRLEPAERLTLEHLENQLGGRIKDRSHIWRSAVDD
jgi:hypothetical protein